MKLEISRQIFEKFWNIKFREKFSSESRVVLWGRKDGRTDGRTNGQTYMTNLIAAFRNFWNAREKSVYPCRPVVRGLKINLHLPLKTALFCGEWSASCFGRPKPKNVLRTTSNVIFAGIVSRQMEVFFFVNFTVYLYLKVLNKPFCNHTS
jgi:hypothetical protein